MGSRSIDFTTDEYYHVYNRGTDKRAIVQDTYDANRFIEMLRLFNSVDPLGGLYQHSLEVSLQRERNKEPLVEVVAYCLNPNHYHLVLKQCVDNGISQYLQRVGTGLSKFINHKYRRTGSLFESKFKAKHLADNDYLLHTSAYVNLNDRVHRITAPMTQLVRSSWLEYVKEKSGICAKGVILDQFKSIEEYEQFALDALDLMLQAKDEQAELKLLEFND